MCADFSMLLQSLYRQTFFLIFDQIIHVVNLKNTFPDHIKKIWMKMELICYLPHISDYFIYDSDIGRCSVTNDYFYLFILFQPVSKNFFSLFQHSNKSIQICVANNDTVRIPFLHKTINANTTSCLFCIHLKNTSSSEVVTGTETFFPKK